MEEVLMIKNIFDLARKYSANKATLDYKTQDRKGQDIVIYLILDDIEFNSSDELYNYLTSKYKSLGDYSSASEFKEIPIKIEDINKNESLIKFNLEHMEFEMKVKKELI